MWKYLAAYLAAVFGGIFKHGGDDINTDEYGMNQTDRDYIAYLKKEVQRGRMTEEDAKNKLISKGGTAEMWDAVDVGSDGLFGQSAGIKGVAAGSFQPMDIIQALTAYFTRNQLTGAEMQQNEFNAGEAQKSREFTEFMARNKYSMETESMQAAGVNPAMVYGGGNLVPTAANGATGTGSALSGGNIADLLSTFIRMPLEMKQLKAEIERTNKEGQAALMNAQSNRINAEANAQNADSNARQALVSERQATVAEMRQQVDEAMAQSNIEMNEANKTWIAKQCAILEKQLLQMDDYLAIAWKNANSQERQALAALRQAAAAVQNAATNDYLSNYQSAVMWAQELLLWAEGEGREIVNKYLDEGEKQRLENLRKEGVKLDAEGRLIDKEGKLVTAKTVHEYVGCGTDIFNTVSRFTGININTNIPGGTMPSLPVGSYDVVGGYGTYYQP